MRCCVQVMRRFVPPGIAALCLRLPQDGPRARPETAAYRYLHVSPERDPIDQRRGSSWIIASSNECLSKCNRVSVGTNLTISSLSERRVCVYVCMCVCVCVCVRARPTSLPEFRGHIVGHLKLALRRLPEQASVVHSLKQVQKHTRKHKLRTYTHANASARSQTRAQAQTQTQILKHPTRHKFRRT
jgi:hypothetical protein